MKSKKAIPIFGLLLLLNLAAWPVSSRGAEFDAMVIPSLMDSDMDGWYKIPLNSGPNIHKASSVYQGQVFNVLIFFRGYSADKDNNLHVRYDVQVYDSKGNPTDYKATDILAFQGPMGNPNALLLNQQYLKIVFTEKNPPGIYRVEVTAYDKVSGKTITSETSMELKPFALPEKIESQEDAGEWLMGYYVNPSPVKAIGAALAIIDIDTEWVNGHLNTLTFFRRVFSDNQFLFPNIAKRFSTFSSQEQKKLLLISAICGDSLLFPSVADDRKKELEEFYNKAKEIEFPDVNGEIKSGVQLDILWSEFLATGRYDPIRRIVGALALSKYEGNLDKIEAGEGKITEEIERNAYLEATYGSAAWSLVSNCKQMPLVFKYCVFIYENEKLDEDIKSRLGFILNIAQEELQKAEQDEYKAGSNNS